MTKFLLSILLMLNLLSANMFAQTCEITEVNVLALPCAGNFFSVSVDLEVTNPSSPGFTLAGNGVIYGTFLYSDLPITVGPLLGDDESTYEFIAWDVENADCQQFTTLPASNCGPICSISNFVMEFVDCVSNQGAIVVFDFDYVNPTGLTFDLFNDEGEELSTWLYESLPVTLAFFEVNGASPIVLTVCDHDNPDCCETFTVDAIDCNEDNCEFYNVIVEPECMGNNFIVQMDFGIDNPASDSFTVAGNNINYGTFGYNELPLSLGPLNGNTDILWEFVITDTELSSCNTTYLLGTYNCPPPCQIQALEALALECNGNDAYALEIGMDIQGEGDLGFAVFSETIYYGNYSYNNLPVTIPTFESACEFVEIVSVCDTENLGCCATALFEALQCCGCLIYNLTATALPCTPEDSIYVQIDFSFQNVSMEGFEVTGDQTNYGEFSYDDLPIQIGPFPGDGSEYFEFVVTDLGDAFCFNTVELGFIDCGDICDLSNLDVVTGDCTGNNTYFAQIDFDYQGVTGVGFDLFVNGELIDSYSYDDLPLNLDEFPSGGTGFDTVIVCENDNNLCCDTLIFESPDCACTIFDATYLLIGCITDSTFEISLEFFYENLPGNSVDIFLDGVFLDFYTLDNLPLTVEIPEGDGNAVLSICASDLNSCCVDLNIELIDCDISCHLYDLVAEPGECNSTSTFQLDFEFKHNNLPPGDSIVVTANNQFVGTYLIQPDFNHIDSFPQLDSNTTTLTVCALGAPDCCDTYTFETPDCSFFGLCHIWDLVTDSGPCTSDTSFTLHIDFNSQNLPSPSDSVTVSANGNEIGTYLINPDGIAVENFPTDENNPTMLIVCSAGDSTCCDTLIIETPDCTVCHLFDLVGIAGNCLTDTSYVLIVDYEYQYLPSDSVIITANDEFIGQFPHDPDGFEIDSFPIFNTEHTTITICAVGAPDCCDSFEFVTPNCIDGGTCSLVDLVADPGACHGDTAYTLLVNYFGVNLHSDSVSVSTGQGFIGHFADHPDGFNIENFPAYNTSHTTIIVCALGNEDCCDEFTFETPDCGQGFICETYDLVAEPGPCNSGSSYSLDVGFQSSNHPTDSVEIYANDLFVGTFLNNPDFIHIDSFPYLNTEETTVAVCAQGDTSCCDTYTFVTPFCTDECVIYDVAVDLSDCNSDTSFQLVVNFQHQNIPGGGFDIYAGDVYQGFFGFDQVPAVIPHFPDNATGEYVIKICAADSTLCCTSFEFTGPICGGNSCNISNIEYALSPCDSTGNFYFIFDFDFLNTGTEGFKVVGNGNDYGNFSYENLPIEIGPFPTDDTDYEFLISDAQHPGCFEIIEPGVVTCIPVSTLPLDFDQFFQVFNNGTVPGIYARKNIILSLFNVNGKMVLDHFPVSADDFYELNTQPAGLYIATVAFGENIWPVKLVKAAN